MSGGENRSARSGRDERSHQTCRERVHSRSDRATIRVCAHTAMGCEGGVRPSCLTCSMGSPVDGVLSSRRQSKRADVGLALQRPQPCRKPGVAMPSWSGMGRSGPWVDTLLSLLSGHTVVGGTHPNPKNASRCSPRSHGSPRSSSGRTWGGFCRPKPREPAPRCRGLKGHRVGSRPLPCPPQAQGAGGPRRPAVCVGHGQLPSSTIYSQELTRGSC